MEKRKRNSETAGAAAQGGTPAGYRNLGDKAGCREHAAETGHRERGDKAETTPCTPVGSQDGTAEPQGRRMERGAVAPGSAWALVTGAGSGIGRCYALRLAALGYRLVIAGNNRAPLETVAEEIRNARPAGRKAAEERPEAVEGPEAAKGLEITEDWKLRHPQTEAGRRGANRRRELPRLRGNPGPGRTGTGRAQPAVRNKASAAERETAAGQRRPRCPTCG